MPRVTFKRSGSVNYMGFDKDNSTVYVLIRPDGKHPDRYKVCIAFGADPLDFGSEGLRADVPGTFSLKDAKRVGRCYLERNTYR